MKSYICAVLATAGIVVMLIGGLVDVREIVVTGAGLGVVAAVVSLVVGLLERRPGKRGTGAAFVVAAVIAGAGSVSWFFLDDSAINIGGLLAMAIGVIALWGLAVPLGRRQE